MTDSLDQHLIAALKEYESLSVACTGCDKELQVVKDRNDLAWRDHAQSKHKIMKLMDARELTFRAFRDGSEVLMCLISDDTLTVRRDGLEVMVAP